MYACKGGSSDLTRLLVEGGAHLETKSDMVRATYHFNASALMKRLLLFIHLECSIFLWSLCIFLREQEKETVLIHAVRHSSIECVRFLLASGADKLATDEVWA